MENSGFNRRTFIGTVAGGLAAPSILKAAPSPNDKIVLGMIGVGGMGTDRLKGFLAHKDVEIGAICDVDRTHLARAVETVVAARGKKPLEFSDFRLLLERNDIDAVAVVTPDHWHSIPVVAASQAGKDVFVEKPLSYSVAEGQAMANAAARYQRVTQMGNHIHNDLPNYRRVVEMVRSGRLGRINRVQCWMTSSTKGLGNPPNADPPTELDYDFWLGPAPERPYNPVRSHGTYRYFWDYSGGVFIDFWCHIVDVAYWALDLKAPHSVAAFGGRFHLTDLTETPDTEIAVLEYPDLVLEFTLQPNPLPGFRHMGHIGCVFDGSEAVLVTNYEKHEIYVDGKKVDDFPRPEPSIPDSPGHLREFLDAIKTRNLETTCNIGYGNRLTKAGLLANIAYRVRDRIHWNDDAGEIVGNENASPLLSRVFRKPWSLA